MGVFEGSDGVTDCCERSIDRGAGRLNSRPAPFARQVEKCAGLKKSQYPYPIFPPIYCEPMRASPHLVHPKSGVGDSNGRNRDA